MKRSTKFVSLVIWGDIILNDDAMLLDEVVVTPQILNTFGNKNQLTLSESSKKVGNNALDAIGSLPQFKTDISNDALVTVDNKKYSCTDRRNEAFLTGTENAAS